MKTILGLKAANVILQKIFVVIGRSTAQVLEDFGINAQIISPQETAEGLFSILVRVMNLEGKRILLPVLHYPIFFKTGFRTKRGFCERMDHLYQY